MTITLDTIIKIGAAVGALGTIGAMAAAILRWLARQEKQDADIASIRDEQREMKEEQCVMSYAMLACLDGLKQLGANGNVTDAHNKLEKHLNKKAHDVG